MKLYGSKIKTIAQEMTRALIKQEAIEVDDGKAPEVELDIESTLKEYLRTDREINDEARALVEKRGMDYSAFGRTKRDLAKRRNFGIGEDALAWIMDQLIELLLYTSHVEEVYFEDNKLRLVLRPILRKHMEVDDELDEEVRKRIKNLSEGSTSWDIKYEQVMKDMKRRKGLEE